MSNVAQTPDHFSVTSMQLPANFPEVLTRDHARQIEKAVAVFSLADIQPGAIATLGAGAEIELNRVLNGFLARIDQKNAPQLYRLVEELSAAVSKEDLPGVAKRIMDAQPSLGSRLVGFFNPKFLKVSADRAYEDACRLMSGKAKTLADLVAGMEKQLQVEQARLQTQIQELEALKNEYRARFVDFAFETAFANALLQKGKQQVGELTRCNGADPFQLSEAQDKLQSLESRALALEGVLSRLPSDQLVIRQLQNAGIATLQEITTTASSRFASIKMTLLTIYGARVTQDVQRLSRQGADLDSNLLAVRSQIMHDVVLTAASAPGDARLAQGNQLKEILLNTAELQLMVLEARANNEQKFQQAREIFVEARQQMQALGTALQPGAPIHSSVR